MIVLLKKKDDPRFLSNRRPITLLNSFYKIGAKAIQKRLTPILQRIISPQQTAFLPGRNIHHALLLMGEMIQQARNSGEEYILMKLDVSKAFDMLDWNYILSVVDHVGMNGTLSRFLKASFSTASSSILLNGRLTPAVRLLRSVRQGCPLSPLIFILAFDPFSHMLNAAVRRRSLVGVDFPHLGLSTLHTMYADDAPAILKAEMNNIMMFKDILKRFGNVSGLRFIWEKTKAVYIGGQPSSELRSFPWTWEDLSNATKVFGFPMACEFAVDLTEALLNAKIDRCLDKMSLRQLTLAGKITVANSLILSTVWYFITLWPGDFQFFMKIQGRIEAFIWAGRSRVNRNTITLSKARGGLGLLLIEE